MALAFRLADFANLLFNLQDVDGFANVVRRIRDDPEKDVEPAYAELQAAAFVHRRSVPVEFVPECGIRGEDYDLRLRAQDGSPIAAEVRCRAELGSTELGYDTIRRTLKKKARQLPDMASMIWLHIPQAWVEHPLFELNIRNDLAAFFKKTGRVAAVALQWELYERVGDTLGSVTWQSRMKINPNCRHLTPAIETTLNQLQGPPHENVPWTHMRDLIPRSDPKTNGPSRKDAGQ